MKKENLQASKESLKQFHPCTQSLSESLSVSLIFIRNTDSVSDFILEGQKERLWFIDI
jgi:hypothetical protein